MSAQFHRLLANGADLVYDFIGQLGLEGGHVVLNEKFIYFFYINTFECGVNVKEILQLRSHRIILDLAERVGLGLLNFQTDHFRVIDQVDAGFL